MLVSVRGSLTPLSAPVATARKHYQGLRPGQPHTWSLCVVLSQVVSCALHDSTVTV